MTFAIGGTAKLRRIVKPTPKPWTHVCAMDPLNGGVVLKPYITRCLVCGARRPK